ncbi:MAG: UpxY family transcription antiterminator [Bacteroidota bacterium]|nr:UpxY family transcription antiterminator [Bacteroidota bacterium]MDP4225486.1 UpxY family transcription antiterminator [Bacteroidota bacterium]MDP4274205.1 UpxY family transcription antiterminator [Bacteroidota bacterium]
MADTVEQWYAFYTKPRAEKKAASDMSKAGITYYLPLHKVMRQWSDRRKEVEVPLFTSYIFVHIDPVYRMTVLQSPSIARSVTFRGEMAPVRDIEIEAIKRYLSEDDILSIEEIDNIEVGDEVEITRGPLKGIFGKVGLWKGKHKVVVEIECVNQKIALTIAGNQLKGVH